MSPRSPSPAKEPSALLRAASLLETELLQLESISRQARKIPLTTEKNIARAAKELEEALTLPERLAAGLSALAQAMATMQGRQQAALEPLAAFASEIRQRRERMLEHMRAFAALGTAAAELTARIQSGGERAATLADADEQLARIASDARALFELSHSEDFPELAKEADALKQRALALRRRLGPQA